MQLAPLRRAPHDREGNWSQGPIALSQLALDVTDEDRMERQPVVHEATGACLAWDGRLDNREELYRRLPDAQRRQLAGVPDADLVMLAWLRWGRDTPQRLVGDFVFAVWDAGRRELFLARDRMGMRPLYYAHTTHAFSFASQIKGVRALPDVNLGLDEDWVADYLSLTHLSTVSTAYLGIRRLPAAHWMSVTAAGKATVQRYWRLRDEPEVRFKKDEDYYDHLREVTRRAVHDRMRGSGPVGSMLSGGLDSSTVTAFACEKARAEVRRVITVSSVLPDDHPGPETDEREYIKAFLEMYPECEWIPVTAPGKHFLSDLDQLLEICDQPVRDSFHYCSTALQVESRSAGARTLLTGVGGDFFLSGRASGALARMLVERRFSEVASSFQAAKAAVPTYSARAFARTEILRPFIVASPFWRLVPSVSKIRQETAASTGLANRHHFDRRQRDMAFYAQYSPWQPMSIGDERIGESGLLAHVLEYFSALGVNFGTQTECPLLDYRVIAAVSGLPTRLRRSPVLSRQLIRRVGETMVPAKIMDRTDKGPFSPDTTRRASLACRQAGTLRGYSIAAQSLGDLIEWTAVAKAASSLRQEAVGWNQDSRQITLVFSALSLIRFLKGRETAESTA